MNDKHTNHDDLHLHADPEIERIESLLDLLGEQDRDSMRPDHQSRVLEAVSQVFAPAPISIEHTGTPQTQDQTQDQSREHRWDLRIAAAAAIALMATLSMVMVKPWAHSPTNAPDNNSMSWSLASFEEDLDAYLALDELGDGSITEAVADWELWAQTIETDFDTDLIGRELGISDLDDGAL
ncbi:MAG: hypothetical protein R3B67_12805 [Phycisphaerales bacterium]